MLINKLFNITKPQKLYFRKSVQTPQVGKPKHITGLRLMQVVGKQEKLYKKQLGERFEHRLQNSYKYLYMTQI